MKYNGTFITKIDMSNWARNEEIETIMAKEESEMMTDQGDALGTLIDRYNTKTISMTNGLVGISDLAKSLGRDRSNLRKFVKSLDIPITKIRTGSGPKQYIAISDAERLMDILAGEMN